MKKGSLQMLICDTKSSDQMPPSSTASDQSAFFLFIHKPGFHTNVLKIPTFFINKPKSSLWLFTWIVLITSKPQGHVTNVWREKNIERPSIYYWVFLYFFFRLSCHVRMVKSPLSSTCPCTLYCPGHISVTNRMN